MPEATEAVSEYTRRVELNIRDFLGWVRFIRADETRPEPAEPAPDVEDREPKVTHIALVSGAPVTHLGSWGSCEVACCCEDHARWVLARRIATGLSPLAAAQALWGPR